VPKRIDSPASAATVRVSLADLAAVPPSNTADLSPPKTLRKAKPGPGGPPKKKRTFWRKLWIAFQIGLVVFIIAGCILGYLAYEKGLYYYAKAQAYDLTKLNDLNATSTFYDVNGEELGRIFVEDRIVLKPEEIPETMRQAVMAAEDHRFYVHGAIDYWGILRALHENLGKGAHGVQGGSTIEQQLAKHLIGDFSRTLDRKFLEAFVAVRLEKAYTKDQIMNYYLNRIYFGQGYFGVGAAARGYFGKDAKDLTLPECALLAGIIRSPVTSSPRTNIIKAKMRRDATIKQMYDYGYIKTHEEYSHALNTAIHIERAKPSGLQSYAMVAAVKEMEQILSIEGTEEMPQGLTIRTNINLRLQRAIEANLNARLAQLDSGNLPAIENSGSSALNPNVTSSPGAKAPLQDAAIVADISTGRVLAWIGGRDFSKSQFDHISMARRENGALLQPLIYALGFDRLNLHPASMINASFLDPSIAASPDDLAIGNSLTDLNHHFLSVQDALALGNRPAATRVGVQLGARSVTDWLRQAGAEDARIPDDKPGLFNPEPMTMDDMASLYQVLGNDGTRHKLKIIRSIEGQDGQVLYDDEKSAQDNGDDVLNHLDAQQLNLTLGNALRTGYARDLTTKYGLKSAIAGMPGYSDGYRDAWFVGYTPKLVAGVWVGYDDSRPLGRDVAVRSAIPLWGDMMQQVETRLPAGGAFPVPPALTKVEIDRASGGLRGLAGFAPAPGDIFVYLKKDQVAAAGTAKGPTAQQLQAPRDWSDWLTTMFNQADETSLTPDQIMGTDDKRTDVIPTLAEYKLPGLRGDILSEDGTVYATMGVERNLVLSWPEASDATSDADIVHWMRSRLDEVQKAIGVQTSITDADLINGYHVLRYQPLLVLENITPLQVTQIQNAGLEAKGFGFQMVPRRVYPHGTQLAHVLGYLQRDQQRNKGKYLSGDVIYDRYRGASGLEQLFNKDLIGKDGRFMISTTPEGYARSAAVADPPTYGNNVRLAIDSKIQSAVEQALTDSPKKMTAAVMLDVHTGDVVAMSSRPVFDPNIFVPAISVDEWQLLNSDPTNPLFNRAIRAQFPPGSTFKTLTSVAAMNAGVFDPNWVVNCTGYFDLDNSHRMRLPEEKGPITYLDALTYSYNTYFATLGEKIGRDVLLDTARSLNIGSLTHIDLPGELPGLLPDPEFVKRVHQREFGYGDIALTAIGQGDVLVTPIQMADLMATYANNGTVYKPRLIRSIEDRDGKMVKEFPVETLSTVTFDQKWMPLLKQAMENVVDEGTAKLVHRDDMKIAAKTGTAQVGTKTHPRQIAWLCGYFPADNPQYSFAIMIQGTDADNHGLGLDDGLLGGHDGGLIMKEILDQLYGSKDKPGDKAEISRSDSSREADTSVDDSGNMAAPDKNSPPDNTAPPADKPAADDTQAPASTSPAKEDSPPAPKPASGGTQP
jgi:penicillin-binding protein 2